MSRQPVVPFLGIVDAKGKLTLDRQSDFARAVAGFAGDEVEVTIRRRRYSRSLQANSYYWGVIVAMISEKTGYTPEETHEILKQKFIPKTVSLCDGNGEVVDEFVIGGSTAKMSKPEFFEYCESIREWAATPEGLRLVIPDPNSAEALAS